jgi:hypothetical protein
VACPYFMPVARLEDGSFLHEARLPLGWGWNGRCTAPGHDETVPSQNELQEFCNLGYAKGCSRLPQERAWDSVRFGARTVGGNEKTRSGGRVQVRYVCERDHLPAEHGTIEFDLSKPGQRCDQRHPDSRVQRMAECFLAAYMEKRKRRELPSELAS